MSFLRKLVMRTPLERPSRILLNAAEVVRTFQHPQLRELTLERSRMVRLIAKELTESSNCIDVGAHVGAVLSPFVRHAPRGRHMAFEPIPRHADWLKAKFPEVDVRQVALSDAPCEATFYVNNRRTAYSALQPYRQPGEDVEEIKVRCETLDSLVAPGHTVHLLKTGAEGTSLAILRGANGILRRDRPVLLFVCTQSGRAESGETAADYYDFLTREHPYSIYFVNDLLKGRPPLDFPRFEAAQKYPFQAAYFAAAAGRSSA